MQDLCCLFGTENLGHFLPTAHILLSPLQLKQLGLVVLGLCYLRAAKFLLILEPPGPSAECWAWLLQGWQVTAVL